MSFLKFWNNSVDPNTPESGSVLVYSKTDKKIRTKDDAGLVRNLLASGEVVNGDVASGAALAVTKLAAGNNHGVLETIGSTPTWKEVAYAYGGGSNGVNQNAPSNWIAMLPSGWTASNVTPVSQGGFTQLRPDIAGLYLCFTSFDARGTNAGSGPMLLQQNGATNFGGGAYNFSWGGVSGITYFNGTSDYWSAWFYQTAGSQIAADCKGSGCVRIPGT